MPPVSVASAAAPSALEALERSLFDTLSYNSRQADLEAVFIMGAPRTGSTLTYQAVCSRFGLPYVANVTNDCFATTPIVGLALQKAIPVEIVFDSRFGKTDGPFQPSEGSGLMVNWFGAGDPPASKASIIRTGLEEHFLLTLQAAAVLFAAPLVIKNAWNCFRVPCLARLLPKARFIWIRREIGDAAKSDLDARYKTKGDPGVWNSALPPNIDELRKLAPPLQVVENQYAFSDALRGSLRSLPRDRWMEIWYEDFQLDPEGVLSRIGIFLNQSPRSGAPTTRIVPSRKWNLRSADERAIETYLHQSKSRFEEDRCRD
jgi:hypothetical protein